LAPSACTVEHVAFDSLAMASDSGPAVLAMGDAGVGLLRLWIAARGDQTGVRCATLADVALLAALERNVDEALAIAGELAAAASPDEVPTRVNAVAWARRGLAGLGHSTDHGLHSAWQAAAGCPLGRGLPALSMVRPDLPLQRGYSTLSAAERIVLLTLAGEAGHRSVLVDANAMARRTGLRVPSVRLALSALARLRWLEKRPDLAPRVVSVERLVFLTPSASGWGVASRATLRLH
jgi:hypothetical protein